MAKPGSKKGNRRFSKDLFDNEAIIPFEKRCGIEATYVEGQLRLVAVYNVYNEEKKIHEEFHLGEGSFGKVKLTCELRASHWDVLKTQFYDDKDEIISAHSDAAIAKKLEKLQSDPTIRTSKKNKQKYSTHIPYEKGVTLAALIDPNNKHAKTIPASLKLQIAINACNELKKIHDKGIFHIDITPSNLLVDEETGDVRILDYGFSVAVPEGKTEVPITRHGHQGFLARNIYDEEDESKWVFTAKDDVYSMGATLNEFFSRSTEIVGEPLGDLSLQETLTAKMCAEKLDDRYDLATSISTLQGIKEAYDKTAQGQKEVPLIRSFHQNAKDKNIEELKKQYNAANNKKPSRWERLKRKWALFEEKHPILAPVLKWGGVVAAGVGVGCLIFFTGGTAAIPLVGGLAALEGAAVTTAATTGAACVAYKVYENQHEKQKESRKLERQEAAAKSQKAKASVPNSSTSSSIGNQSVSKSRSVSEVASELNSRSSSISSRGSTSSSYKSTPSR